MKFAPHDIGPKRTHEWLDQRSLAMDKAIAKIIRSKPELLDRAKATLARWIQQKGSCVPIALLEWQEILAKNSLEDIMQFLVQDDEEARRLRQSSPFCGILPEKDRLAILQEFESRRS